MKYLFGLFFLLSVSFARTQDFQQVRFEMYDALLEKIMSSKAIKFHQVYIDDYYFPIETKNTKKLKNQLHQSDSLQAEEKLRQRLFEKYPDSIQKRIAFRESKGLIELETEFTEAENKLFKNQDYQFVVFNRPIENHDYTSLQSEKCINQTIFIPVYTIQKELNKITHTSAMYKVFFINGKVSMIESTVLEMNVSRMKP